MATRIYLPWENERGVRGLYAPARALRVSLVLLMLGFGIWIWRREEGRAAVRATRASITTLWQATRSYRADHQGECPRELSQLVAGGYVHRVPVDAWGNPFRLECKADWATIVSDGPDGQPYGLDRVE